MSVMIVKYFRPLDYNSILQAVKWSACFIKADCTFHKFKHTIAYGFIVLVFHKLRNVFLFQTLNS